jgi:hypothetical protein
MDFKMNLSSESWVDVFNIHDDIMFNNFLNTYLTIFNHTLPHEKFLSNYTSQPWITAIKVSCARKRELFLLSI